MSGIGSRLTVSSGFGLLIVVFGLTWPIMQSCQAATIRGYVVDADGRRIQGAKVEILHMGRTDQSPPQRPKSFGKTTTDARGNFVLSADPRLANVILASFKNQAGLASPSSTPPVRVVLRRNKPRISSGDKGHLTRPQIKQ